MSTQSHHLNKLGSTWVPYAAYQLSRSSVVRSQRRRFFKAFYHIWAWRPFWSCDLDHLNKLWFSHPMKAPYERTYCKFVLRCAYGKSNFQRWSYTCTNMIKRSLNISSLYLSTLFFFHLYVFSGGGIVVEYMYCLPHLTLSLWKNVTPCAFHDLISSVAPPAPGLSYITIYW